jgi:triosephosphate isomerase
MRPLTIIANWKMNGSLAANDQLLAELLQHDKFQKKNNNPNNQQFGLCVPYPYLSQVKTAVQATILNLGAQDVSDHPYGAYTGDVSANMLKDFECRYVIIGHSERRQYHQESDALVARKSKAALLSGITPIVCVGETEAERNEQKTVQVVRKQLQAVLDLLQSQIDKCIIAYEPVWAIGTGQTPTAEEAQEVHRELRLQLAKFDNEAASKVPIIYGGSLKPENAQELLKMPDIDGGLIGGCSLIAKDFLAICQAG